MSLAEVFYLSKSEPVEQERRVADIDDGYTRFANELLEAIASADLTARQLKVSKRRLSTVWSRIQDPVT